MKPDNPASPFIATSSPRLRVLQCITRLGLGGAERVALAIARELQRDVDFAIFTVHGASRDAIGDGMRRELAAARVPWFAGSKLPMKAGGMLPGAVALARAVRAFGPDAIHFHSETPEACGAMMTRLVRASRDVPIVRTIHNSVYWRYWPRVGRWCDHQLARAHIACVSEAAREEFRRFRRDSGAKPPPPDPAIVYNGVSLPRLEPRRAARARDVCRVLFAGRFEPQKGTDVLCAALQLVRLPDGTRGEITFLGHGAHESLVRALVQHPPRNWTVTLRPTVADLPAVLPEYDLMVIPSRFEGLGLVAIEATLCGLPVVATDAPGLREALPSDYPWRAAPGDPRSLRDCVHAAFSEMSRWPDVVGAAQRFAQVRFSPAAMGENYQRIYARAAGERAERTRPS
jgi:glycosyltransferase involved in cell wall biosynthesis